MSRVFVSYISVFVLFMLGARFKDWQTLNVQQYLKPALRQAGGGSSPELDA